MGLICCGNDGSGRQPELAEFPVAGDLTSEQVVHFASSKASFIAEALNLQNSWIRDAIADCPEFMHVASSTERLDVVVNDFKGPMAVSAGQTVISQGDEVLDDSPGLFIIESGVLDVFQASDSQDRPGTLLYSFEKRGQIFGHLAVLLKRPRNASVICRKDAVLWHISRHRFAATKDEGDLQRIVDRHCETVARVGLSMRSMSKEFAIFNVNMVDGQEAKDNLPKYYALCRESKQLSATTSCFTPWHKNKKANGHAKVIPAIRSSHADKVRVFFFDDNIEWDGKEKSPGICNLRDVTNGDFVEFGEGANGFHIEQVSSNSFAGTSDQYRNVLVQVNILDAMEDEDYFINIIKKYALPDEKVIVFMDCNATIISNDSISGKGLAEVLLGTMFQMIRLKPEAPFDFAYEGRPTVKIEKAMDLKTFIKKIAGEDNGFYVHFFKWENCAKILAAVSGLAKVMWVSDEDKPFDIGRFKEMYERYLNTLVGGTDEDGITQSWYKLHTNLTAGGHSLVLNSFGVDTRKVIVKTVSDEHQALHLCMNFELWSPKDIKAFEGIYNVTLGEESDDDEVELIRRGQSSTVSTFSREVVSFDGKGRGRIKWKI